MKALNKINLKYVGACFVFLSVLHCKEKVKLNATKNTQPNIIFIMSDDHAYQAISAYNHHLNNTPNIDRLAKEGAIFNSGFVTNSICAPSRAVMLTGKHSFVNGKIDNLTTYDWNQDNFAKQLQKSGYDTALVGKIHLEGTPQGFNYWNIVPGQGDYYNPDFIENGQTKQHTGYVTNLTTNFAINWIDTKRDKTKPFLLLYHQKAPHRPWMPDLKYIQKFKDSTFKLPSNFYDDYKDRTAAGLQKMSIAKDMDVVYDLKMLDDDEDLKTPYRELYKSMYNRMNAAQKATWDAYYKPLTEQFKKAKLSGNALAEWKYQRYMQDYLGTIQSVDDGVGELLNYLDAHGLAQNTIVVYTSDQGFYLGEHGWFDKRFMYEESFRTPILMRYPKEIKAGTQVNELIQNLDFAPTFLDYANVKIPEDIQGESFRDILNGTQDSEDWRDAIYYTFYEFPGEHEVRRHYGIRTKHYKLIHFYYDINTWELYDLDKDPLEMNNLYNHPEYTEIQVEMHSKLNTIREKYGDTDALYPVPDVKNIKT